MADLYVKHGQKREHTLIVEQALGKPLRKGAVIHHVDGDKKNNENTNLVVCPSQKYHSLLHAREEALRVTGNPDLRRCLFCYKWVDPDASGIGQSHPARGDALTFHRACVNAYNKQRKQIRAEKRRLR